MATHGEPRRPPAGTSTGHRWGKPTATSGDSQRPKMGRTQRPLTFLRPTPACAGITTSARSARRRSWAHPRMRGDHSDPLYVLPMLTGPPPHARGSRVRRARLAPRGRPTPACAGITTPPRILSPLSTAHPRMRGDHGEWNGTPQVHLGPPQHARGSPNTVLLPYGMSRPTPACAGITAAKEPSPAPDRAHPRMRGDHIPLVSVDLAPLGPPPHARGSHHHGLRHRRGLRPTPECAGITMTTTRITTAATAHPRMRGDHSV